MPVPESVRRNKTPRERNIGTGAKLLVTVVAVAAVIGLAVITAAVWRGMRPPAVVAERTASSSLTVDPRLSLWPPGSAPAQLDVRYYSDANPGNFIEFHADGTVFSTILGALGTSYTVNGDSVTISGGIAGSVTGKLSAGQLVFEGAGSGGIRNSLVGTWVRR